MVFLKKKGKRKELHFLSHRRKGRLDSL